MHQRLGRLNADQSTADDDDILRFFLGQNGSDALGVVYAGECEP